MMADLPTVAALNDTLRCRFVGGRIVMTSSVAALPAAMQAAIVQAMQGFDAFTEDNDPYGEHDCAIFEAAGHRCMFKIDYYDLAMAYASPDPADASVTLRVLTLRVLTLMLACDY